MKATKEITLDIALEHLPITVQAKQGDVNTRFIICNIANGLEKISIPSDCFAMYTLRKPDGTQIVNQATIKNNQVTIALTAQCLTVAGRCPCEVTFYDRDKNQLSSITFYINVQSAVFAQDLVASSSEYNILLDAIEDATSAANAANAAAENANTAATNVNTTIANANTAITRANAAADKATAAANSATTAATAANTATGKANTATTNANAATTRANTAADKANTASSSATSAANAASSAALAADTATVNANTAADYATGVANRLLSETNEQIQTIIDTANQAISESEQVKESTIEVRDETRQALNELKRDNNQYANALSKEVKGTQIKVEDAREKALFEQIKLNGKTTVIKANQEERISPDNPAEISGIGQSNTIDLIVATRNLCYVSLEDMTTTANGVTVKYTGENQQIQLNGTISKVGFCMRSKVIPISVEEGEQFKFWLESISGGYSANSLGCFSVEFLNKEGQKVQPRTYCDLNFGTSNLGSIQISKEVASQITGYQISVYGRTVGESFQNYTFRAQLEKGEQTKWEACQIQKLQIGLEKPLYNLPNGIYDNIEKRGEKWGVVRRVGKGEFKESNRVVRDRNFDAQGTFLFKIYFPMPGKLITANDFNVYCNLFYIENIYAQSEKEGAYLTDGCWIRMKKSRVENTEESTLLEWAKTGGGSEGFVLYGIKEQFEEFGPEIQLQLNELHSYQGTTQIMSGEQIPKEIIYLQDSNIVINQLTQAVIELGGQLNV